MNNIDPPRKTEEEPMYVLAKIKQCLFLIRHSSCYTIFTTFYIHTYITTYMVNLIDWLNICKFLPFPVSDQESKKKTSFRNDLTFSAILSRPHLLKYNKLPLTFDNPTQSA